MIEFSERMFYKVRFNLELKDPEDDLLWKIVLHIKNWMVKKYNSEDEKIIPENVTQWTFFKNGDRIFSNDDEQTVYMESDLYQDAFKTCWACKIAEKGHVFENTAARTWTTQIGLEMNEGEPELFSCIITYNDSVSYIGKCQDIPKPTIPRIIGNMINDRTIRCFFGHDEIIKTPLKIEKGYCPELWNKIADEKRALPYFILSPCPTKVKNEMVMPPAVNEKKLAEYLCGNAIVYYSDNYEVTKEIKRTFPIGYDCPLGNMRVYYPGIDCSEENNSKRHKYFSQIYINKLGEEEFLCILRRVFAQDLHYTEDKDYIIIDYCKKLHRIQNTQKRIEEERLKLKKEHKEELNDVSAELFNNWVEESEQHDEAEKKCKELEAELSSLKDKKYQLEAKIDSYREYAQNAERYKTALNGRNVIETYPGTPEEIADYFREMFCDRLAFSDDIKKSLKTCSMKNEDIWRAFYSLATVLYDIYQRSCEKPFDEYKLITGIECAAKEASMTHKDSKLMQQYVVDYKGEKVNIESHLKFRDSYQRVHFGLLSDGRILIAHCGEHLDTAGTRRRKN